MKSSIKWINPQVYEIFLEEKDLFIAKMDVQLDAIARDVQTGLTTANNQIQAGKDAVTNYIRRCAATSSASPRNSSKTC